MRIQRLLARAGVASRRHAEDLVRAKRVTVNGTVAQIGQTVSPHEDEVRVDGALVRLADHAVWIVLHKPARVMTTRADSRGRTTVFDLVDDVPGLTYVGRLDYDTEGLLLLTTDGTAAHVLMHPGSEVERTYVAIVRGDARAAAARAKRGVELEDGPVRPRAVRVRPVDSERWELALTITEGRKREVRRLCKALDLRLERLLRTRYGPVSLGDLPAGKSRALTPPERRGLDAIIAAARRAS